MFKNRRQQKELEKRFGNQKSKCECGYPFPLQPQTWREGFTLKRIYSEYKGICEKCGLEYIRIR